mmetsp:Transcript_28010/g.5114  ORF Transcript_28010/g.5114 Transcript_28010/m.5114 type:complete len:112 (-) Transcript_28010:1693-2028(-)
MSGGHMNSDITCVAFSSHLCLIASGSSNGIVSIWDFEMGKLEASCFGHKKSILALEFVNPYALLVTAASDGTFCIWPVRPHPGIMRYHCICRIANYSWNINKDIKCNITSI